MVGPNCSGAFLPTRRGMGGEGALFRSASELALDVALVFWGHF